MLIFFSSFIVVYDKELEYQVLNRKLEEEVSYMKLVIPKINLDLVIYDLESELNNVDYNVQMLSESVIERNVYFLAGHSGRGDNCYFHRLKELEINDLVYLYQDNVALVYEVIECFYIVKDGYMEVDSELENVLYLITCSGYNRQLIIKCTLIN